MTDNSPIHLHQRSAGHASAAFDLRDGRQRLADLRQQGSAKAIMLDPGELVFLNTSGGLTGGDALSYRLDLGPGTRLTATTQTAERIYRSTGPAARMGVRAHLGAGSHLDWLPQETILFDRAHAQRRTEITLAEGATCLTCETLVLGRAAMGETIAEIDFHDWRMIRRGDTPLHLEALRLDAARLADNPAGLGGARALATVVMIDPRAETVLDRLRAALAGLAADGTDGTAGAVRAAASALPGRLVLRLMAADGWPLRQALARILALLRGSPLPRVWQG